MIRVFYDGNCPLCLQEIDHYRAVAPAGVFDWLDISADPAPLQALGISQAQGLRALHAEDHDGRLHTGVDAFRLIWRHLKRWRWLAMLAGLPGIRQVLGGAYRAFAAWRFRRLGYAGRDC